MIVTLQTQGLHTLEQVRGFMAGNAPVSFTLTDAVSARVWMTEALRRFGYGTLSRSDKGRDGCSAWHAVWHHHAQAL